MQEKPLTPHGRTRRLTLLSGLLAGLFGAVRTAKADECGCLPAPDCTVICPNGGSPRADGTQACDCNPDPIKPRALSLVDGGDAVNSTGWNGWLMRIQHNLTATKLAVFDEINKSLDFVEIDDIKYVHPDSGVEPGTYTKVTVDKKGHVTAGSRGGALDAWPVGAVFVSFSNTDPGTLIGGVWESLGEGRVLIGAGSRFPVGSKGGEETHKLTTDEMPSHTHSGSSSSAGGHSHTRGTMNITGSFDAAVSSHAYSSRTPSGAFSYSGSYTCNFRHMNEGAENWGGRFSFNAANTWSGSTSTAGSHSHTMSLNNTGGSQAHNNMQPYVAVYMWKRIA